MNLGDQFLEHTNNNIDYASGRIIHCLDQLEDKHIWFKPDSNINSIGIIINHLYGNLRQAIISGIGGVEDIRNRPLEFDDSKKLTKNELKNIFQEIINECKKTIHDFNPDSLLEERDIYKHSVSALNLIYGTVIHFDLHAGQITYITRLILKSNYKEFHKSRYKVMDN